MWNTSQTTVSAVWPDAAYIDAAVFTTLFASANAVCSAYAPAPALDASGNAIIPENWKMAEILQAIHVWGQKGRGNGDTFGPDGMPITTYSLVYTARDLLRPKTNPMKRLA